MKINETRNTIIAMSSTKQTWNTEHKPQSEKKVRSVTPEE